MPKIRIPAKFKSAMQKWQSVSRPRVAAYLGRTDGTIAGTRANFIWVTDTNGFEQQVFNDVLPANKWGFGLPVWIERIEQSQYWQVVGIHQVYDQPVAKGTLEHSTSHTAYGNDPVWVWADQFMPWLCVPASLTLKIYRMGYWSGSTWIDASIETLNMATHVPTSGARYALLEVDTDGTLEVTDGSVVAAKELLEMTDIPSPTAGRLGLCAVRLYAGQTVIIKNGTNKDIYDLRFSRGMGNAGGSTPGGADTQVQVNDGGVLAGFSTFTFRKVNPALKVGNLLFDCTDVTGSKAINWRDRAGIPAFTDEIIQAATYPTPQFNLIMFKDDYSNLQDSGKKTTDFEPANANIQSHIGSTSNPHSVTAAQAGADITSGTTHAATSKTTPVDADEVPILDSAATYGLKKLTWANIKATLKTYLDTLYQAVSAELTAIAGLSPSNDDVIQRKSGAWANRTMAQLAADLTTLAPLASPALTGNPTAPTASAADNDTSIATTGFVQSEKANGWTPGTGTWSYSSADAPTFVISINADVTGIISVGMRIKLTQTTVKYFIVTAVGSFGSGVTLVTVYGGTDYTLANAAISSPFISPVKTPFGFPISPTKWTVEYSSSTGAIQASPTTGQWYNCGSKSTSIPIGGWLLSYSNSVYCQSAAAGGQTVYCTLSTASNSSSDSAFNCGAGAQNPGTYLYEITQMSKYVVLAAKTTYYVNIMCATASINIGDDAARFPTIIRAVCAYI
jgi:hypothetical protein